MRFPIYAVDIDLHFANYKSILCRQEMMTTSEFRDHDATQASLCQMVLALATYYEPWVVWEWDGCIYLDRMDTWCEHYKSHYTYETFESDDAAKSSFQSHLMTASKNDAAKALKAFAIIQADWIVCHCETCKQLNRTMILHSGDPTCRTCSSLCS